MNPEVTDPAVESVRWLVETFRHEICPFEAVFDNHAQTTLYRCWGCDGEFVSEYPKWVEPTDETFPHHENCKYIAAIKAAGIYEETKEEKTKAEVDSRL